MESSENYLLILAEDMFKLLIDFPYFVYIFIKSVLSKIYKSLTVKAKSLENEIILVTGAASGLGREVVLQLAQVSIQNRTENKVEFVLWDVNEKGLKETKEKCGELGFNNVHTYVVDLTKRENIAKFAELVRQNDGTVTMLYNNAGIAPFRKFMEMDSDLEETVIKINLLSYMWTIKEFLPDMLKNGKGHIICTCSGLGFHRFSHVSAYCASKYGLHGFLETLKLEIRQMNPYNPDLIKFTTIYPGFIKTPMTGPVTWESRYKSFKLINFLDPKWAAGKIVDEILKEKEDIYVPGSVLWLKLVYNLWPTEFMDKFEKRTMKNLRVTDHLHSRTDCNTETTLARDHGE